MRTDEHIARLRDEGRRLVDLVETADLTATVPTCPEWTVGELARHVGRVHRWATAYVRDAIPDAMSAEQEELTWGRMPEDKELPEWLRDGHHALVAALQAAPENLECFTFLPAPSALAFWARRQHHETTIHRVDAQRSVPSLTADDRVPAASAVDGVDELLCGFFSRRRNRLRSTDPQSLAVVATDTDAAWMVYFGPEGSWAELSTFPDGADASVRGTAESLYIGLWNRGELEFEGDPELISRWRELARVRWS